MTIWIGSVALAAVVSFFIGAFWYGVLFGTTAATLHPAYAGTTNPDLTVMALEFARCALTASALALLIARTGTDGIRDGIILVILVWAGFQVIGLAGSVLHEGYPARLYAIHMGDALVKGLASALIICGLTARFA